MTKSVTKIKDHKLMTDKVIARMLTENTGSHFLDSGGAYGRGWQRRAGMGVDDFRARPAVSIEVYSGAEYDDYGNMVDSGDGSITLDTFHYLSRHLTYNHPLTLGLHRFGRTPERANDPWLATMEEYAAYRITGRADAEEKDIRRAQEDLYFPFNTFNSYNHENFLSSDIQGVAYTDARHGAVVILHTHNGCDIRGGYSTPHVFSIDDDEPHEFFDWCSVGITCTELGWQWQVEAQRAGMLPGLDSLSPAWAEVHEWDHRSPGEWSHCSGSYESDLWEGKPKWRKSDVSDDGTEVTDAMLCPRCSAPVEVHPWP